MVKVRRLVVALVLTFSSIISVAGAFLGNLQRIVDTVQNWCPWFESRESDFRLQLDFECSKLESQDVGDSDCIISRSKWNTEWINLEASNRTADKLTFHIEFTVIDSFVPGQGMIFLAQPKLRAVSGVSGEVEGLQELAVIREWESRTIEPNWRGHLKVLPPKLVVRGRFDGGRARVGVDWELKGPDRDQGQRPVYSAGRKVIIIEGVPVP